MGLTSVNRPHLYLLCIAWKPWKPSFVIVWTWHDNQSRCNKYFRSQHKLSRQILHIYQVFKHDTHYQHKIISQDNNIFTVFFYILSLDKLNIPKVYSDAINWTRTDHTMAKRNKDKWTNNDLHNIMLKVKYRATLTPPVVLSEPNCLLH